MVPYDDSGVDTLHRDECLRLLGSVPIGRVAFTTDALPSVQPVTFALHGTDIVFRTRPGSRLDTALRNSVVAFQADEHDPTGRSGWSVTAVGRAALVRDRDRIAELERLPLPPPAPGRREHYVTVSIGIVSGYRFPANGSSGR